MMSFDNVRIVHIMVVRTLFQIMNVFTDSIDDSCDCPQQGVKKSLFYSEIKISSDINTYE